MGTWLEGPRNDYRWFWPRIEQYYPVFLRRVQARVESPDPTTVLRMFYTSVILLLTKHISYDVASTRGEPAPKLTEDGSLTAARLSHGPIVIILEENNKVLYELFDDEYCINFYMVPKPRPWKFVLVANRVPRSLWEWDLWAATNRDLLVRFKSDTGSTLLPRRIFPPGP